MYLYIPVTKLFFYLCIYISLKDNLYESRIVANEKVIICVVVQVHCKKFGWRKIVLINLITILLFHNRDRSLSREGLD